MRKLLTAALMLVAATALAQDPLAQTVVLKLPGMEQAEVRKDIVYDGTRKLDLYRPPKVAGALPVVLFINGVGAPNFKEWGQYTSWPRLVASKGLAAISYQTEGDSAAQTDALLRYVREHAAELKIDAKRIAIWACSANGRVGTALVANQPADAFRAAVFYYALMETAPKHAELPVLLARAGLENPSLNRTIDRWAAQAVAMEAPVTLLTYPQGRHGFELVDDTDESRRIVQHTLEFLKHHLTATPSRVAKQPTPVEVDRMMQTDGVAKTIAWLHALHRRDPGAFVVHENYLNSTGYILLGEGKQADAVAVLELVTVLYPESANAHDSLGDAYEAAGEAAKAIVASERALELLDKTPPFRREAIRASAEAKLKRLRKM